MGETASFFWWLSPPKQAAKDKRKVQGWNISMQKALDYNHPCVSNSGSPPSLIMCKAHFHIEIRLHSKCGGSMRLLPHHRLTAQKKGQLHRFDWGAVEEGRRLQHFVSRMFFYASVTFYIAHPAVFLGMIICPHRHLQSHLWLDLFRLILLKDRRVINGEYPRPFTPTVNKTLLFNGMELSISVC